MSTTAFFEHNLILLLLCREFVDKHVHIKAISPMLLNRQNRVIVESAKMHDFARNSSPHARWRSSAVPAQW